MSDATAETERQEQQRLMAESAGAFARRELAPSHLRQGAVSRARWAGLAELGLTAVLVPEEEGGLGLRLGDIVPAIEELGRPLLREPLVACAVMPAVILAGCGAGALRSRLLAGIADGGLMPAVAWQEGPAPLVEAEPASEVRVEGDGLVLSGAKRFVLPGDFDGLVVSARAAAGTALLWVEPGDAGVTVEHAAAADGGAIASVRLDAVRLGRERLLADDGASLLAGAVDAAAICAAAELLGLVRGAVDMTLSYLRTRKQFGRTIGAFQALQHRAADLYVQQELCAVALARAVADFEAASTPAQRSVAASRAKARCSAAALHVTKEAIQMHGGIGYTDEHDIGLYLKRALVLSAWLGNAAEHRARFAALTMDTAR